MQKHEGSLPEFLLAIVDRSARKKKSTLDKVLWSLLKGFTLRAQYVIFLTL